MPKAFSQDLRDRVIQAGLRGSSAADAARRFGVSHSAAVKWIRRAKTGEWSARQQGGHRRSQFDKYHDYLSALIQQQPDITLYELQARLQKSYQVKVGISTLWGWLRRSGLKYK
ncbi:IS630 transposase-related protein [Dongshaea marina]|uniref:IS630 transposase-related protein n=1 Tax=Dongshaea marina TaxID=2047966 RepID=UPI000D3E6BB5|nr:IS630 transposase-related protein [Dongshaea marina]